MKTFPSCFHVDEPPFITNDSVRFTREMNVLLVECIGKHKGRLWKDARDAAAEVIAEYIKEKMDAGELRLNPRVVDVREDLFNPDNWIIGRSPTDRRIVFFRYVHPKARIEA